MLTEDRALTAQAARIEALLAAVESFPDPALREQAAEIIQGMLFLYGEGLGRMLTLARERLDPPAVAGLLDAFAADELVAHLLLLHDLHPRDLASRVQGALAEVRPYLQSHGGNVELIDLAEGVAHLRLEGSCHGCPSSTMTLKLAIEESLDKAAPDLLGIEVEGVVAPPPPPQPGFVPVGDLLKSKPARGEPGWSVVSSLDHLSDGNVQTLPVAGQSVLFLRAAGALYAYHDACPGCGQALGQGALTGVALTCPGCGRRYDIRAAGRGLDDAALRLQPIPLLAEGERVKVALRR